MAPIQRRRRRGLHTVHQVSLQQFRKSVLRQSTVMDNIRQSVPGTLCSSSKRTGRKYRSFRRWVCKVGLLFYSILQNISNWFYHWYISMSYSCSY